MSGKQQLVTLPLRKRERRRLLNFGEAVLRSACPVEQSNYCSNISHQLPVGNFSYIYAGVLLATRGRIIEAMRLFSSVRDNAFVSALATYLADRKSLHLPSHFFQSTIPFNVWTRTAISRLETRATIDAFTGFVRANGRLEGREPIAILDIGTGNGILLVQLVNQLALSHKIPAVRLYLLDSSAEMLRAATDNCHRLISIPIEVVTIHSRIESLPKLYLSLLRRAAITFSMAASCLHHLPEKDKISVFSLIRSVSPILLLEELEANHDSPEKDSPELVWSVKTFYDSLIRAVSNTKLPAKSKQACINSFLLAEAVGIVANSKEVRGNYHSLLCQWMEIAKASGFQINGIKTKRLNKSGLCTLALNLKSAAPLGK